MPYNSKVFEPSIMMSLPVRVVIICLIANWKITTALRFPNHEFH